MKVPVGKSGCARRKRESEIWLRTEAEKFIQKCGRQIKGVG